MNLATKLLLILLCIITLVGCEKNINVLDHDQQTKVSYEENPPSSGKNNESIDDEEQPLPNFAKLREDYIESYNKVRNLDTLLVTEEDTIRIALKYYSLLDNSIVIPKEFIWEKTEMNKFVTHSFVFDLTIEKNKNVIFDSTITKSAFESLISDQLKNWGVLKFPNFNYNDHREEIVFQSTIWIPITDLGSGFYFIVDKEGNTRTSEDYPN